MKTDFTPIKRQTVPEQVVAAIRSKIVDGELSPGDHLREAELAAKLGVSRAVLREAFRQLIGEGLLVTLPHRGTFVWQPTCQEFSELLALRAGIESICVRLILTSGRRQEFITALDGIVENMAVAEASGRAADQIDQRFHETIVRMADNRQIWQVWTARHPSIWLASWPAFVPEDRGPIAGRHRRLLEILAGGSPSEAQEAIIAHIEEVMQATPRAVFVAAEKCVD